MSLEDVQSPTPRQIYDHIKTATDPERKNMLHSLSQDARETLVAVLEYIASGNADLDRPLFGQIREEKRASRQEVMEEFQAVLIDKKFPEESKGFDRVIQNIVNAVSNTFFGRISSLDVEYKFFKTAQKMQDSRNLLEREAQQGSGEAYYKLGKMDLLEHSVLDPQKRAEMNFRLGASLGDIGCQLEMVKILKGENRVEEAQEWMAKVENNPNISPKVRKELLDIENELLEIMFEEMESSREPDTLEQEAKDLEQLRADRKYPEVIARLQFLKTRVGKDVTEKPKMVTDFIRAESEKLEKAMRQDIGEFKQLYKDKNYEEVYARLSNFMDIPRLAGFVNKQIAYIEAARKADAQQIPIPSETPPTGRTQVGPIEDAVTIAMMRDMGIDIGIPGGLAGTPPVTTPGAPPPPPPPPPTGGPPPPPPAGGPPPPIGAPRPPPVAEKKLSPEEQQAIDKQKHIEREKALIAKNLKERATVQFFEAIIGPADESKLLAKMEKIKEVIAHSKPEDEKWIKAQKTKLEEIEKKLAPKTVVITSKDEDAFSDRIGKYTKEELEILIALAFDAKMPPENKVPSWMKNEKWVEKEIFKNWESGLSLGEAGKLFLEKKEEWKQYLNSSTNLEGVFAELLTRRGKHPKVVAYQPRPFVEKGAKLGAKPAEAASPGAPSAQAIVGGLAGLKKGATRQEPPKPPTEAEIAKQKLAERAKMKDERLAAAAAPGQAPAESAEPAAAPPPTQAEEAAAVFAALDALLASPTPSSAEPEAVPPTPQKPEEDAAAVKARLAELLGSPPAAESATETKPPISDEELAFMDRILKLEAQQAEVAKKEAEAAQPKLTEKEVAKAREFQIFQELSTRVEARQGTILEKSKVVSNLNEGVDALLERAHAIDPNSDLQSVIDEAKQILKDAKRMKGEIVSELKDAVATSQAKALQDLADATKNIDKGVRATREAVRAAKEAEKVRMAQATSKIPPTSKELSSTPSIETPGQPPPPAVSV